MVCQMCGNYSKTKSEIMKHYQKYHIIFFHSKSQKSPAQRKVGAAAAQNSFEQLLVQHKCTVMGKMDGIYLQVPYSSLQGPSSLRGPPD